MTHPTKWAVIENAGYVGERVIINDAETAREAWDYVARTYGPDEQEALHVDVAHWDAEGEFWSYDH